MNKSFYSFEKTDERGEKSFNSFLLPQMLTTKRYTKHCILAHVMRSVPQGILHNDRVFMSGFAFRMAYNTVLPEVKMGGLERRIINNIKTKNNE